MFSLGCHLAIGAYIIPKTRRRRSSNNSRATAAHYIRRRVTFANQTMGLGVVCIDATATFPTVRSFCTLSAALPASCSLLLLLLLLSCTCGCCCLVRQQDRKRMNRKEEGIKSLESTRTKTCAWDLHRRKLSMAACWMLWPDRRTDFFPHCRIQCSFLFYYFRFIYWRRARKG